jgi:8-oxo-dGTP diphosphatase
MTLKVSFNDDDDTRRIAKVILISEDKVLLLMRKVNQRFAKQWDLPGGHLRKGESWIEGAVRETKEETNIDIRNPRLILQEGVEAYFVVDTLDFSGRMFNHHELPEHDAYTWLRRAEIDKLKNISEKYYKVIKLVLKRK